MVDLFRVFCFLNLAKGLCIQKGSSEEKIKMFKPFKDDIIAETNFYFYEEYVVEKPKIKSNNKNTA